MPWRATAAVDGRFIRDSIRSLGQRPAGRARDLYAEVPFLSRAAMLKAAAVLIAVSMLSVYFGDPGGSGSSARIAVDAGSFTAPVRVNDNPQDEQASPVMIATPDHRLYAVWEDMRSGDADIYFSKSVDNGKTFTSDKRVDDSGVGSLQIKPAIALSENGTILLVWQDSRMCTFDYDIFFAKSYDNGATFARNVKVDDSNNSVISWQERPSVAATQTGGIYIAWTDDRTGTMRVRGALSTNGGETFSPSEEITPSVSTGGQTGVTLVSNFNRIYAAFIDNSSGTPHPYVCISTNGGKSFASPIRLDNTGSAGVAQKGVAIAPMPDGGIVAAWDDSRNGNWDIYASIVSSHGTIIASDIRVDDDNTGAWQYGASIVADQLGNVYASWTDERNYLYAIRFAYLSANEAKFNSSIEVAHPGVDDIQRESSVVVTDPGKVFVIWEDDRGGVSSDIYSAYANFPDLFELSLRRGWNFVSIPTIGHDYAASTLDESVDQVATWDPAAEGYTFWWSVFPQENNFTLVGSTGYWVLADTPGKLRLYGDIPTTAQTRVITVPQGGGWAIVGFASLNTGWTASDVVGMYAGGAVDMVASWDQVDGMYTIWWSLFPEENDFPLVPGQAYWVRFTASGTLSYAP